MKPLSLQPQSFTRGMLNSSLPQKCATVGSSCFLSKRMLCNVSISDGLFHWGIGFSLQTGPFVRGLCMCVLCLLKVCYRVDQEDSLSISWHSLSVCLPLALWVWWWCRNVIHTHCYLCPLTALAALCLNAPRAQRPLSSFETSASLVSVLLFADGPKTNNTVFSGNIQLMPGVSKYSLYFRGLWKRFHPCDPHWCFLKCQSWALLLSWMTATHTTRQMWCCLNGEQSVTGPQWS